LPSRTLNCAKKSDIRLDPAAPTLGFDVDTDNDVIPVLDHFLHIELVLVPSVEPLIPVPKSRIYAAGGRSVLFDRIPLDLGMKGSAEGVVRILEGC
jgi:hypothetical protein